MSNPHDFDRDRTDTADTVIVTSAFVAVALAIGGILYAYSNPETKTQAASNLPPLTEGAPAQAAQ